MTTEHGSVKTEHAPQGMTFTAYDDIPTSIPTIADIVGDDGHVRTIPMPSADWRCHPLPLLCAMALLLRHPGMLKIQSCRDVLRTALGRPPGTPWGVKELTRHVRDLVAVFQTMAQAVAQRCRNAQVRR